MKDRKIALYEARVLPFDSFSKKVYGGKFLATGCAFFKKEDGNRDRQQRVSDIRVLSIGICSLPHPRARAYCVRCVFIAHAVFRSVMNRMTEAVPVFFTISPCHFKKVEDLLSAFDNALYTYFMSVSS